MTGSQIVGKNIVSDNLINTDILLCIKGALCIAYGIELYYFDARYASIIYPLKILANVICVLQFMFSL